MSESWPDNANIHSERIVRLILDRENGLKSIIFDDSFRDVIENDDNKSN